jgi:secreted Zn-dependent insulinase-like peptidase
MKQDDHALVIYLPAQERTPLSMALFMLMNHLVSPEYFHALRTEQQLGYLVGTGYVPMNLKPGIAFYIQSPKVEAADLYYATLIFYRKFLEELPELTLQEFDELKKSLQGQIKERDNSLSSRAKRVWLAIGQGDAECQLASHIQQQLELLTLAQFIEFCYTLLAPDYDAIFLATGAAPKHSHMQQLSIQELCGQLKLQQDDEN